MFDRQRGGIILKLIALLILVLVLAVVYLVRRPILRTAGEFWVVDEPPEHADAIVVLSDDNYWGERAVRAAELYRAGWAPRVVASGRMLRSYAGIAELMQRDLVHDGVPVEAVVRFPHQAGNTREEAQALRGLFVERGWKHILLVTSNYHTRRARYICERVFPPGTSLRVVAAKDSVYDPDHWWQSRAGVKMFFYESFGMMMAMWEARHEDVVTTGLRILNLPTGGFAPFPAPL